MLAQKRFSFFSVQALNIVAVKMELFELKSNVIFYKVKIYIVILLSPTDMDFQKWPGINIFIYLFIFFFVS